MIKLVSVKDFHELCANREIEIDGKSVPLSRAWMKDPNRRSYSDMKFIPGQDLGPNTLNEWQGFNAVPSAVAECTLWLKHVRDVLCSGDEELFDWVLKWFAHLVQRPWEKPGTAIAIYSPHEGVGKDIAIEYFGRILGVHFVKITDPEQLTGRFNVHRVNALLITAPETFWSGDRRDAGKLKALVTESDGLLERKGIDAVRVKTFERVIVTSNDEWLVNVGLNDRRWLILDVVAEPKLAEYWKALARERDNGGVEALLHYLLSLDLEGFNPRKAPMTPGRIRVKAESLKGFPKYWLDRLSCGSFPGCYNASLEWPSTLACDYMRKDYIEWHKSQKFQGEPIDHRKFGKSLREFCPDIDRQKRGGDEQRVYVLPSLEDCRTAFENKLGGPIEWGESD